MRSYIIQIIVGLILLTTSGVFYKKYQNQKEETRIAESNIDVLTSTVQTYKTEHGNVVSMMRALQLDYSSLEQINSSLSNKVEELEIKIKNVSSVVEIKTEYVYLNQDTVKVLVKDSIASIRHITPLIELTAEIDLIRQVIPADKLSIYIPNTTTLVTETQYRGWWIFKKVNGMEVHVMNSNPFIQVPEIFYIEIK